MERTIKTLQHDVMALVACQECGREISTQAASCPGCGAPRARVKPPLPAKPAGPGCGTLILVLLGGFAVLVAQSLVAERDANLAKSADAERRTKLSPQDLLNEDRARNRESAPAICRAFIRRQLHDPGSAEFISDRTTLHSDDSLTVVVELRAKNAFNALRVMSYDCHVQPIGAGDFRLLSLKPYR